MAGLPFRNRAEAGRELAARLSSYAHRPEVIVLGLPRGGVPVAFEVARALGVPLDLFLVRKLGVPGQEELAMGAIASGGIRVLNEEVVRLIRLSPEVIEEATRREAEELARRDRAYRGSRPAPELAGRIVILVDDGLATGSSMRAAAEAVRAQAPQRLVVAVPVAARETCTSLAASVDEIICAYTPEPFQAVGLWYEDFSQTTDQEVSELLARSSTPADSR